jgi:predicted translation initiation factor SUI1
MAKARTILFLCTGNHCRSRFAEVLFNSIAKKMGVPWTASSRGLALERGVSNVGPMAISAIDALKKKGIDHIEDCGRLPLQVTASDLQAANRIVALNQVEHLPLLQERHHAFADRVEFWDIGDTPETLARIEAKVMDLLARLLGGGGDAPTQPTSISKASRAKETSPKPILVQVGRETAGRRGKGVTTVFDTPLDADALRELAAKLKQRCGTGGTVKDGRIEIQGDQRERVITELEMLGYQVKRVGG